MAQKPAMHGRDHKPGGSDPIPAAVADPVEWATFAVDNMSLGTTFTAIDWGATPGGDYDTTTPTFAVNASANVVIAKAGYYRVGINATGWALTATVNSVLLIEVKKIAGASGNTAADLFNTANGERSLELLHYDSSTVDFDTNLLPSRDFDLVITQASIDGGGAQELQVRAYIEEDATGVAHAEGDWRMMIVRGGTLFV